MHTVQVIAMSDVKELDYDTSDLSKIWVQNVINQIYPCSWGGEEGRSSEKVNAKSLDSPINST